MPDPSTKLVNSAPAQHNAHTAAANLLAVQPRNRLRPRITPTQRCIQCGAGITLGLRYDRASDRARVWTKVTGGALTIDQAAPCGEHRHALLIHAVAQQRQALHSSMHPCNTPGGTDSPSACCRLAAASPTDNNKPKGIGRHIPQLNDRCLKQQPLSTGSLADAKAASWDPSLFSQGLLRGVPSCADTFSGRTVRSGRSADDWMRGVWTRISLPSRHNGPALTGLVLFLVAWRQGTGVVVPHSLRVGSPLSLKPAYAHSRMQSCCQGICCLQPGFEYRTLRSDSQEG